MAKLIDQALVVDVESTCWDHPPPVGQMHEIIEIGLTVVDLAALTRREKRCFMVRPQKSQVGTFCTKLTSITQDMVEKADDLEVACNILINEYQSPDRLFVSWGDYDRGQFARNCREYGIQYPFGPTHLNVKNMFAIAFGMVEEPGIDTAMNMLGLPMEGTHHRGVDDAWNIAHLFCLLLKRIRHRA